MTILRIIGFICPGGTGVLADLEKNEAGPKALPRYVVMLELSINILDSESG